MPLRFSILSALLVVGACSCGRGPRATGPLPQEAYVWQRVWTKETAEAVQAHGAAFRLIVALGAEVSWPREEPRVARASIDYEVLRSAECGIGLALRIGPFKGPFSAEDSTAMMLAELAGQLAIGCRTNGVRLQELQIDFDCADSKLDGYRLWIEAIRKQVEGIPLVITALPSWLDKRGFERLAASAGGYVLQVHSLERPRDPEAGFELCNPRAARRAVERAARFGVPFRVALPTYGYLVAFDRNGKFLGLAADGSERVWPDGAIVRGTRADPDAMAELVRGWTSDRPEAMTGVIWYRLPVGIERLNWSWPTLAAVMSGRPPRQSLRAEAEYPRPGLVEVKLINDGERGIRELPAVRVEWDRERLIAGDGLAGFRLESAGKSAAEFVPHEPAELKPGERRTIGWLRLDTDESSVTIRIL